MKKIARAELEFRLQKAERELAALREWFFCESLGSPRLEVRVLTRGGASLNVRVHGVGRSAGGVCVVEVGGIRTPPEFLDDLRLRWSEDQAPEIREGADRLVRAREQYLHPSA